MTVMAKIVKVRGKQESFKSFRDLKVENYKGRRANGKFAKCARNGPGIPTSGLDLGRSLQEFAKLVGEVAGEVTGPS
ncbi:hypothetical protein HZH68_010647 [Vespula germanica]|uniref:Uncharacterized protein n=1 Tax=Vespula germanica TaxID=30212 RepID=A0A834N4B4_VESGE|nr:hypothetical protein HZH68_010647 [Vespula germanica]